MDARDNAYAKWRNVESVLAIAFYTLIIGCVVAVLLYIYKPSHTALGALASVSMDVVSMFVIIVLTGSVIFDKEAHSRTTKIFLGLMIGTVLGLFLDFLTWSSDGSLAFGGLTYLFTVASLCTGSILACIFVLYFGSYLDDMYGLKKAYKLGKICAICNIIAFCVTLTLALTHTAFDFVDGHYQPGELYDIVTAIPVLTLVVMSVYAIKCAKVIGVHDILAVIGYIVLMIAGALVESEYNIGTTYIGVTIADAYIFVMLQNKMLNRIKVQKDMLSSTLDKQYEILDSMSDIYTYISVIDYENMRLEPFNHKFDVSEDLDLDNDPHSSLNKGLVEGVDAEQQAKFLAYTDLSTLRSRMSGEKIISSEFHHINDGWFRAHYIRVGEASDKSLNKVIYAVRNINEEKKNVEEWIKKSNTDELTNFYNRRAYEAEIAALEDKKLADDFVYVSIDVNGLKVVNDTLGHAAGDELIIGACECMRLCYGAYGKLYRTGGDEFVALINVGDEELEEVKKIIRVLTRNWKGLLNDKLAISCGYVLAKEAKDLSLHQIAVLADKRMYEDKSNYYRSQGIDRRGRRASDVADD